jgi:hypothetical protein
MLTPLVPDRGTVEELPTDGKSGNEQETKTKKKKKPYHLVAIDCPHVCNTESRDVFLERPQLMDILDPHKPTNQFGEQDVEYRNPVTWQEMLIHPEMSVHVAFPMPMDNVRYSSHVHIHRITARLSGQDSSGQVYSTRLSPEAMGRVLHPDCTEKHTGAHLFFVLALDVVDVNTVWLPDTAVIDIQTQRARVHPATVLSKELAQELRLEQQNQKQVIKSWCNRRDHLHAEGTGTVHFRGILLQPRKTHLPKPIYAYVPPPRLGIRMMEFIRAAHNGLKLLLRRTRNGEEEEEEQEDDGELTDPSPDNVYIREPHCKRGETGGFYNWADNVLTYETLHRCKDMGHVLTPDMIPPLFHIQDPDIWTGIERDFVHKYDGGDQLLDVSDGLTIKLYPAYPKRWQALATDKLRGDWHADVTLELVVVSI